MLQVHSEAPSGWGKELVNKHERVKPLFFDAKYRMTRLSSRDAQQVKERVQGWADRLVKGVHNETKHHIHSRV